MQKYKIDDIDKFVDSARRMIFKEFGKSTEEIRDDFSDMVFNLSKEEENEMDEILSQKESRIIVESMIIKQKNKSTKKVRYVITEKIFMEILESLNARLVSNILSALLKKGVIESAYDDEMNDFVFWIKNNETPEAN